MHEINDRSRDIGPFVPGPDDDMIICRCEEVTKGEIRKAVHDGMFTLTEIRRYLRTGMGLCQGPDLCKAGQRNRGKRTERIPGRTGTGNIPGTDASDRDARVCGRGKGGRGR